jgi:hypothetical protein
MELLALSFFDITENLDKQLQKNIQYHADDYFKFLMKEKSFKVMCNLKKTEQLFE